MDKRFKARGLGLIVSSTGSDRNNQSTPSGSQIPERRAESFPNFQKSFLNKRKKSPSPDRDNDKDNVPESAVKANLKKRRSNADEDPENQKQIESNRSASKLSDSSQFSVKSHTSVMSELISRRQANTQRPSSSTANVPKSVVNETNSGNSAGKSTQSKVSPSKSITQKSDTPEFQRKLRENDLESSPLKATGSKIDQVLLRQLTTPSKDGECDSDNSMFGSDSSSAKKQGKNSLESPRNDNDNDPVISARKNVSRRILEVGEITPVKGNILSSTRIDEVNKISSYDSPDRPVRNEPEFATPRRIRTKNKFVSFLSNAGVTLMEGDEPHEMNDDPNVIKDNLKKILQSKEKKFKKQEIIEDWKNYIEVDSNLKKATEDIKVIHDAFPSWFNTSLIKLLLKISDLQKPLLQSLLEKLNEIILEASDPESVSWTFVVVQQIRFLEFIVDPEALTQSIEAIIEATPMWFQKELIVVLPDIIVDSQHHKISDILMNLLDHHDQLMSVILDTLSTLSLGEQRYNELRSNLINKLEETEPCRVPAITRFVLNNCPEKRVATQILQMLRTVHLEPLPNSVLEECFTNQLQTVENIKSGMKTFKTVVQAAVSVLETFDKDDQAKPMDLIYLLILFTTGSAAQKTADTILKRNIRCGYYRKSLFTTFYKEWVQVAQDLEPSALELATNLVKNEDRLYSELGIEWFVLIFMSREEIFKQREVLEKILELVGCNNSTAKKIFTFLSKLIVDERRRSRLQSHCNLLKILLEKLDDLDLESSSILSDVFHGMCIQTHSIADSLNDDLAILMQKQLTSSKLLTKCKGVLSACMAIKHYGSKSESIEIAKNTFEKVKRAVKFCPRSRALFYDHLSTVVSKSPDMDENLLQHIVSSAENALQEYLHIDNSRMDMEVKYDLSNDKEQSDEIVINFKDGKFGGIVPIIFRLFRMCNKRLFADEETSNLEVLLKIGIFLPRELDDPDPRTLDYMLYSINWFRELISGFVEESDSAVQRKVLKRLDNLMKMQGDFQLLHSSCPFRYEPPLAYFHHFPDKPFVNIEKKTSKKAKKGNTDKSHTLSNADWEMFDLGSLLVSKNPTYFRKLDTKIVHLLNIKMDMSLTQSSSRAVSIAQVCFVVKELLCMMENDDSESLIQDLIHLLPQICSKLSGIADELRINEIDDPQMREALELLLRLINKIFSWKELFNSAKYRVLRREGLTALASQIRGTISTQITEKNLVADACSFFEQMGEIAERRSIVLAYSIISVCETLMKHAKTVADENSAKYAEMAYTFLQSEDWLDKQTGTLYRKAAAGLIKTWLDNESSLKKILEIIKWLSEDVQLLELPCDSLRTLPSINKSMFPILFKKIIDCVMKMAKTELKNADKQDRVSIAIWLDLGTIMTKIEKICTHLRIKNIYLFSVRCMINLVRLLMTVGLPILEHNLSYQTDDVLTIVKQFQRAQRYLHKVYCTGTENKDMTYTKYGPTIKAMHDEFICRMSNMMAVNGISGAFSLGNLFRQDLDGNKYQSQVSTEETSSLNDLTSVSDPEESNRSEILGNDEELSDVNEEGDLSEVESLFDDED